ncbi:MAG: hypothetical protein LAP39_22180 [Acidobacteriia bacterium]|nr:hypothetical protein [Terriglobia bacterium]
MKITTWGSVVSLLLAAMSWHSNGSYALLLDLVFCVGAIAVIKQAVRAHKNIWAFGFTGMALLLNPVVPALPAAGNLMLLLFLVCLWPLLIAFGALMDASITLYPNLITDLHPRGEPIGPAADQAWAQSEAL